MRRRKSDGHTFLQVYVEDNRVPYRHPATPAPPLAPAAEPALGAPAELRPSGWHEFEPNLEPQPAPAARSLFDVTLACMFVLVASAVAMTAGFGAAHLVEEAARRQAHEEAWAWSYKTKQHGSRHAVTLSDLHPGTAISGTPRLGDVLVYVDGVWAWQAPCPRGMDCFPLTIQGGEP